MIPAMTADRLGDVRWATRRASTTATASVANAMAWNSLSDNATMRARGSGIACDEPQKMRLATTSAGTQAKYLMAYAFHFGSTPDSSCSMI